jgi:hypothetical protein
MGDDDDQGFGHGPDMAMGRAGGKACAAFA